MSLTVTLSDTLRMNVESGYFMNASRVGMIDDWPKILINNGFVRSF